MYYIYMSYIYMHNPPGYAGIVWMQFSTYTTLRYGCFFKNGAYSNDLSDIGKHDGNHRSLSTWFSVKHVGI